MRRYSFIVRVPDSPGSMQKGAEIIKEHKGNIERIHYDREIDPNTVFFELSATDASYGKIRQGLDEIGYLQTCLEPVRVLKFHIYLPNRPGELLKFLGHTTDAGANIAFLDFDEAGKHPDRLTVTLTVENGKAIESYLNALKSSYRLEILEYDSVGSSLDDAVFYVRFAQNLREIVGGGEDEFLLKLMHDINHVAQELTGMGQDPKKAFKSIIETGRRLKETSRNFYADVQKAEFEGCRIHCFQPPCGGNIYFLESGDELVMVDSGYGIYYPRLRELMGSCGLKDPDRVYISHADADHAGSAGFFKAESWTHPDSMSIIEESNRAYGSATGKSILPQVYTRLINMFSEFNGPLESNLFSTDRKGFEGIFPVIDGFRVGNLEFKVLEGLGGHLRGQVFFLCEKPGILFTGDSLMNFKSISAERAQYNLHAKNLMTTVNVDSENAKKEREGLIELAKNMEDCLLCCGHGSMSRLSGGDLVESCEKKRYPA